MVKFKNRSSQYINRRKLIVLDEKKHNNGKLEELIVDVVRDEGTVSVQGTKLDANSLNAILEPIYNMFAYIFQSYLTAPNMNVSWVQETGILKSASYQIGMTKRFYGKVVNSNSNYIKVTCTNNLSNIKVDVKETQNLNNSPGTHTTTYTYNIEIYLDQAFTMYITKYEGNVTYTMTSSNPSD